MASMELRGTLLAAAASLTVLVSVAPCGAEPQANAGLTLGAAAVGSEDQAFDHAEFHLGLRADLMLGRDEPDDFGLGPYLEIGTFAFDELQLGGGATVHLPIHPTLPLVAAAGPFARVGDDGFGFEPGLAGSLFWGTRSYNFHANYVMAAGLLVGYRHVFGDSGESALLIAAQLDLAVLALPVVLLINWARGPTDEAAPIE